MRQAKPDPRMNPLQDLIATLDAMRAQARAGKVYFYSAPGVGSLRHGQILLYGDGRCRVELGGQDGDAALLELEQLQLGRIVALPGSAPEPPSLLTTTVPIAVVIDRLRRRAQDEVHAPRTATPAAATTHPAPAIDGRGLRNEVARMLEDYFGAAATRRVEELVAAHAPERDPQAFLLGTERLLATMIGAGKATEMVDALRRRHFPDRS